MGAFEIVINCIIALGSLATVGTFIKMIHVGRKQNERITHLEEQQIDAEYRPNLRVEEYGSTNYGCSVTLKNYGNNLVIRDIVSTPSEWLKRDSVKSWFPLHMDEGDTIILPLVGKAEAFQQGTIVLTVEDKLGRLFCLYLSHANNKLMVSKVKHVK